MGEDLATGLSLFFGVVAAVGCAVMIGEDGEAKSKAQSLICIVVGIVVWLVSFRGLESFFK